MTQTGAGAALVTGATGFIGGRLAATLSRDGWEVSALVRREDAVLPDGVRAVLRPATAAGLRDALEAVRPEVVFHLATLFRGRHAVEDVESLIDANVLFGTQLAEALTACPPRAFVNVGTAWQRDDGGAYRPAALYAATKQAMEDILRYYAEAGAYPVADVKLFDTYGPGDERGKLLGLLDRASHSGERLRLSPGDQLIDLLHVDDVVAALRRAAEVLDAPWRSWSAHSGHPLAVRRLVEVFAAAVDREVAVEWGAIDYRAREMFEPWDAGPTVPGWSPAVSLDAGLADVFAAPAAG